MSQTYLITSVSELQYYLSEDKRALGKKTSDIFGDSIWKLEIHLRIAEYLSFISRKKGFGFFLRPLYMVIRRLFIRRCAKRCCEIPLNCIGPGLCIWHGFGIIINPGAKIGKNFGISAFCNIGHAHNKVPTIGDNVTMTFGSQIIGDVTICDNVTIGAKSLVLKSINTQYCTVAGIPAKILTKYNSDTLIKG